MLDSLVVLRVQLICLRDELLVLSAFLGGLLHSRLFIVIGGRREVLHALIEGLLRRVGLREHLHALFLASRGPLDELVCCPHTLSDALGADFHVG